MDYYDVEGLPTVIWNGTFRQVGAGTDVIDGLRYRALIQQLLAEPSPFKISVHSADFTPPTGSIDLDIEVMQDGVDITSMVLRMSLNEDDVEEGGDTHHNVTRDMLDEVPITVSSLGQVQNVTSPFDIDASWNADNLKIIAFLQDDADWKVLTCASSEPRPDYSLRFYSLGDRQVLGPQSGIQYFEPFRVFNSGSLTDTYTVDLVADLPAGWSAAICDDQVCYGPTYSQSLGPGESMELHVLVDPSSPGFAPISVQMSQANLAHEFPRTIDYGYLTENVDVLLVDDDEGESYETWFNDALSSSGYTYGVWNRLMGPVSADILTAFPVVVWNAGRAYPTVDADDRAALTTHMDAGGSLLITGQSIGREMTQLGYPAIFWYRSYLQAFLINDDTDDYTLDGMPGDPISDGIDLVIQGGDGADNQSSPSAIDPAYPTATVIWKYDAVQNAALRIDTGTYRAIYLAFGFEGINNAADRHAVMVRSLDWLTGGSTALQASGPTLRAFLGCAPNPARSLAALQFDLPIAGEAQLSVFSPDGRLVRTLLDGPTSAGTHVVNWDLTDTRGNRLPAGVYFYRLQGREVEVTRKVLVLR